MSKYHSRKIRAEGQTFDSVKEYRRWQALRLMEQVGAITDLQRQVKYILIPTQRAPDTRGPRGGTKAGELLEKECSYYADFTYRQDGQLVVEDVKGLKTPEYIIKRKLMLYLKGIRITET